MGSGKKHQQPVQQIYGPVGNVAGGDIEHHYWLEPEPPDDPAMSTQCPQCGRLTWRHSRHCIHCRLDLVAWARWARRGIVARRAYIAAGVMACLGLFAVAVAGMFPTRPIPRMLSYSVGGGFGLIGLRTAFEAWLNLKFARAPGALKDGGHRSMPANR